jgi:acetyl esterase/lipase
MSQDTGTAVWTDEPATVADFRVVRRSTVDCGPGQDDVCVTTHGEAGPSIAGRLVALMSRLTVRPALALGSYVPHLPWPFGIVEFACGAAIPSPRAARTTVTLPTATAHLVRAPGVPPADGSRRVVLYLHGGAFLSCGANSHNRVVTAISHYADAPVLVVNYRLIPKHSVGMALDDCHDAYRWLRRRGYEPEQIVLAGDSAGGYLALALAQRLQAAGEQPAALVAISPLLQLAKEPKQAHPNINTDAMFGPKAFDALVALVAGATAKHSIDDSSEELYEPLDHIEPGLPPTLIHVSGSEALLHDAQLAAAKLTAVGVPAEVRIWPGQIHDFQLTAPLVPEAANSLHQIGEYIRAATPHTMGTGEHPPHRFPLSTTTDVAGYAASC